MVHARRLSAICGLLALCSAVTLRAKADTTTQTGFFTDDNEVLQIPFSTATTQSYDFYTTSYAMGGFDPVLTLFTADGNIFPGSGATNGGSDANLMETLGPGSYILALTEFPNYSSGTLNSFTVGAPSALFFDPVTQMTTGSNYTVTETSTAVTPEPPSALLMLLPLGALVVLNRRRLLGSTAL